jgi:hypothetical protein
MQRGRPHIFEQWMVNMAATSMQHVVIPMVATGTVGLTSILRLQHTYGGVPVKLPDMHVTRAGHQKLPHADLIYVDSSHEEEETLLELRCAWSALRSGGALFGDDFDKNYIGVQRAVRNFATSVPPEDLGNRSAEDMQAAVPSGRWMQVVPGLLVDAAAAKGNQWVLTKSVHAPTRSQCVSG